MNWSHKVGNSYVRMCLNESPWVEADLDAVIDQMTPEERSTIDNADSRRRTFRRLSTIFHPDIQGTGNLARFQALNDLNRSTTPGETIRLRQQAREAARRAAEAPRTPPSGSRPATPPSGASRTPPRTPPSGGSRTPPPAETVRETTPTRGAGRAVAGGAMDLGGFIAGAKAYEYSVPPETQQALADVGFTVPETSTTSPMNFNANELAALAAGEAGMKGLHNLSRYRTGANPFSYANIIKGLKDSSRSVPGGLLGSKVASSAFDKAVKMVGGPEEGEGFRSQADLPIIGPVGVDTLVDIAGYIRGSQMATQSASQLKSAFRRGLPKATGKLFGRAVPVVGAGLQAVDELGKGPYSEGPLSAALNVGLSTVMPVAIGAAFGGPAGAAAMLPTAAAGGGVALGSEIGRGLNTYDQSLKNRRAMLATYNTLLAQASTQQEKDEIKKKIEELTPSAAQSAAEVPLDVLSGAYKGTYGALAGGIQHVRDLFEPDPMTTKEMQHASEQGAKSRGFKTAREVDAEQKAAIDALRKQAFAISPTNTTPEGDEEEKMRSWEAASDSIDAMFMNPVYDVEDIDDETAKAAGYSGQKDPRLKERRDAARELMRQQQEWEKQQQQMQEEEPEPEQVTQVNKPRVRAVMA